MSAVHIKFRHECFLRLGGEIFSIPDGVHSIGVVSNLEIQRRLYCSLLPKGRRKQRTILFTLCSITAKNSSRDFCCLLLSHFGILFSSFDFWYQITVKECSETRHLKCSSGSLLWLASQKPLVLPLRLVKLAKIYCSRSDSACNFQFCVL